MLPFSAQEKNREKHWLQGSNKQKAAEARFKLYWSIATGEEPQEPTIDSTFEEQTKNGTNQNEQSAKELYRW